MFQLIEMNVIQTPLFDPAQSPEPGMTNSMFLRQYTANLLKKRLPQRAKVRLIVIPLYMRTLLIISSCYQCPSRGLRHGPGRKP